jgi:hypothetical protein
MRHLVATVPVGAGRGKAWGDLAQERVGACVRTLPISGARMSRLWALNRHLQAALTCMHR